MRTCWPTCTPADYQRWVMNKAEKENLLNLLGAFRAYCPDILMAGDGSFRWKSGNYVSPYELHRAIHDAKTTIEKLAIAIEAIDVDDPTE